MSKQENWYVVYTYPNTEKRVTNELGKRNITAFLPTTQVLRQWSDRIKNIEVPLFPSYVFVRVQKKDMWAILLVAGVVKFISFDNSPTVIKDAEIETVKKVIAVNPRVDSESIGTPVIGETVRVKRGPMVGLVGKVVDRQGKMKLYLEIESINKAIAVDINHVLLDKV